MQDWEESDPRGATPVWVLTLVDPTNCIRFVTTGDADDHRFREPYHKQANALKADGPPWLTVGGFDERLPLVPNPTSCPESSCPRSWTSSFKRATTCASPLLPSCGQISNPAVISTSIKVNCSPERVSASQA